MANTKITTLKKAEDSLKNTGDETQFETWRIIKVPGGYIYQDVRNKTMVFKP